MFKGFSAKNSSKKPSVDEVLSRGVSEIFPNKDYLRKMLGGSKKMTLYLGIDPTGPTLHLGHAIVLRKLREFQALGHRIVLLIGDFTGMIGDPTDKTSVRKKLSREEVLFNSKLYKKQAETFLNFNGANKAIIKYNSKWLSSMNFGEVLELASNMTVDQMLKRDMFDVRMKEEKPIYLHEFLYPLLQAYDSVAMDVDGEIGGNDQMFNMLLGRTLMKQIKNKEKFVVTMKLLEDSHGVKMGKTEGNMISLNDSAVEMFGKVMSWTDGMIFPGFELCTLISVDELKSIEEEIKNTTNPKDLKSRLAKEITKLYHGEVLAKKAKENFDNTFKEGGISEDAMEVFATKGEKLSDILIREKVVSSRNEVHRLCKEGAVKNVLLDRKIKNKDESIVEEASYKIGKRRFLKIKIK